jgi:hypothetical protein
MTNTKSEQSKKPKQRQPKQPKQPTQQAVKFDEVVEAKPVSDSTEKLQSMVISQSKKELKKINEKQSETIMIKDGLIKDLMSIRLMDDEQHEELLTLRKENQALKNQLNHMSKMTPAERRKYAKQREDAIQLMEKTAKQLGQKVDVRALFNNIL